MVFGNMGETSATGVAFTRDPSTGEKKFYGEFLINAQGEDVVAGIRTPQDIRRRAQGIRLNEPSMEEAMPEVYAELMRVYRRNSRAHYRDMQDLEFTVERGKLYMLQTRNGKRTAKAALKIAVDMARRGPDIEGRSGDARRSRRARSIAAPTIDPDRQARHHLQGFAGVAWRGVGRVVFDRR